MGFGPNSAIFSVVNPAFFAYWTSQAVKKWVQDAALVVFFACFPAFATDISRKDRIPSHPAIAGVNMHPTTDLLDEVQELVWALVDEQATEEQAQRLERLLLDNREARQIYITCMQMHADLHYLLGGKKELFRY